VIDDFQGVENSIIISNKSKEIKISSPKSEIDKVIIYDLSGRQIYMKSKVDKDELIIDTIVESERLLIVKVVLQNQSTISKKIIY
jgi:hypothetical protein